MIQIAVLGYGTVGSGVVEVIHTNFESIKKRAGDAINIKYVLDIRKFPGSPVENILTDDFEEIINDPEVQIVVEVMGGIEPAYTFVKRCLFFLLRDKTIFCHDRKDVLPSRAIV